MSTTTDPSFQRSTRSVPGPLAPWRLAITVVATAVLTGQRLLDALMSGVATDFALLRSFGVAALIWVSVGLVNRVLVSAMVQSAAEARLRDQLADLRDTPDAPEWSTTD